MPTHDANGSSDLKKKRLERLIRNHSYHSCPESIYQINHCLPSVHKYQDQLNHHQEHFNHKLIHQQEQSCSQNNQISYREQRLHSSSENPRIIQHKEASHKHQFTTHQQLSKKYQSQEQLSHQVEQQNLSRKYQSQEQLSQKQQSSEELRSKHHQSQEQLSQQYSKQHTSQQQLSKEQVRYISHDELNYADQTQDQIFNEQLSHEQKEKLQVIVSALDSAAEDQHRKKFQARCKLAVYFPKEEDARKEFDKQRMFCYFPELEDRQIRRTFRRNSLLYCYFPELNYNHPQIPKSNKSSW